MNKKMLNIILRQASIDGDLDAARIAIENGADVEDRNVYGDAPLMQAVWFGNTEVVRLLLDAGATFTQQDRVGVQQEIAVGNDEARRGLAAIDAWQAEQSRPTVKPGHTPTPLEVRAARDRAGLTQAEAARMVYSSRRQWQRWESGENMMHPAKYRMFVEATGGDRR